jgi:hypothetical protein
LKNDFQALLHAWMRRAKSERNILMLLIQYRHHLNSWKILEEVFVWRKIGA